jgi:hypothetical protein
MMTADDTRAPINWSFNGERFALSFYNGEETVSLYSDDLELVRERAHGTAGYTSSDGFTVSRVTIYELREGDWYELSVVLPG